MQDLIKQKHIYFVSIYKQLLVIAKEIFVYLLVILILVFYYYICICICTYSFTNDNDQLTTSFITSFEELKSVSKNQSGINIWYKYLLDDFFNKFTSKSKSINYKFIEVKSDIKTLILLELKHDISTVKKSVILNKIQSDSIKNIISECEFYKNKTSLLEIQLLKTKIAYHTLIRDIDDITKEMHCSLKKS
jgi:hypothetical protein